MQESAIYAVDDCAHPAGEGMMLDVSGNVPLASKREST